MREPRLQPEGVTEGQADGLAAPVSDDPAAGQVRSDVIVTGYQPHLQERSLGYSEG